MININSMPHLASFLHNVTHDIEELKIKSIEDPNLTHTQLSAISELEQNHNITIKMVDKGGNVVLMDTSHITLHYYVSKNLIKSKLVEVGHCSWGNKELQTILYFKHL